MKIKMAIPLNILYEDNHVIAIDKPARMLVQGDSTGDPDLLGVVREFIKKRDHKPGNVFLGLVHRLDRPVSGAIIIAKTSKGASRLSETIRSRQMTKIYHAIIEGIADHEHGELVNNLKKDRAKRITSVVATGGKEAKLTYRVLRRERDRTFVEINLITGAPHQIRAQFSHIGHPIVGDVKYGAEESDEIEVGTIALHSHIIRCKHPTRDEEIEILSNPPASWGIN